MKSAARFAWGLPIALLLGAAPTQADETVTLNPGEYRTVELAKGFDPIDWAKRNGIDISERLPGADGGSILRFEMDEGVWRAHRDAICTDMGVSACGNDFCESWLAPGAEAPARAFLLPRAPDVSLLFPVPGATPANPDQVPGAESCSRADSSLTGPIATLGRSSGGGYALPAEKLGKLDAGCWQVVAAQRCEVRARPLSDITPEHEPRRLLALVPVDVAAAGNNAADARQQLEGAATALGLRVLEATELKTLHRLLVRFEITDTAVDADLALEHLGAQAGVEAAQHEYRYRTSAAHTDPFAWMNYGARLTGADQLHGATTGTGVTVAVIDTGADATSPELSARLVEQIDVTGFGLSADRHGTAIASLIAGEADNGINAYGMAPGARVLMIKACQPEARNAVAARCWTSTIAKALDLALARDARIINMSLGGPKDPLIERLIEAALANSRLVIAAAGNGGPDAGAPFPASMPNVLAVTAIDARAQPYSESTRGDFVDIAAPGVQVPVAVPGSNNPGLLTGTSMAAAHASGIAALVLARNPSLTGEELRAAMEATAVDLGAPGSDKQFGRGRIDGCAAAARTGGDTAICVAPAAGAGP